MASIHEIVNENLPGPFFVDNECIGCDNCAVIAPHHFKLTKDYDHAFVFKQPTSEKEEKTCISALKACPVYAIGKR